MFGLKFSRRRDHRFDPHGHRRRDTTPLPGEQLELTGELSQPIHEFPDALEVAPRFLLAAAFDQHTGVVGQRAHRGERLVQLVNQPGRHLPQRRHLLGMDEIRLRLSKLGGPLHDARLEAVVRSLQGDLVRHHGLPGAPALQGDEQQQHCHAGRKCGGDRHVACRGENRCQVLEHHEPPARRVHGPRRRQMRHAFDFDDPCVAGQSLRLAPVDGKQRCIAVRSRLRDLGSRRCLQLRQRSEFPILSRRQDDHAALVEKQHGAWQLVPRGLDIRQADLHCGNAAWLPRGQQCIGKVVARPLAGDPHAEETAASRVQRILDVRTEPEVGAHRCFRTIPVGCGQRETGAIQHVEHFRAGRCIDATEIAVDFIAQRGVSGRVEQLQHARRHFQQRRQEVEARELAVEAGRDQVETMLLRLLQALLSRAHRHLMPGDRASRDEQQCGDTPNRERSGVDQGPQSVHCGQRS